jgi:hypothetical protein
VHPRSLRAIRGLTTPARLLGPLAAVLLAVILLAYPRTIRGEDNATPVESACRQVTPLDAPFGCLEVFPLGESASVTFDGVERGFSPLGITEVAPGDHTIRLDRAGYVPWISTITVSPGEVRRLDPPLAALPAIAPAPGFGDPYPLAVMVENAWDARPQTGLDKADVVYEALAEGGISRFMAIYITQEADVIGPVRSTRHYFVYGAAEYNAALAQARRKLIEEEQAPLYWAPFILIGK